MERKVFTCSVDHIIENELIEDICIGKIYEIPENKDIEKDKNAFNAWYTLMDIFEWYTFEGGRFKYFEATIFGEFKPGNYSIIYARKIRFDKEINLSEYLNGKFNDSNGNEFWFLNGEYHRDDDMPAVIRYDKKITNNNTPNKVRRHEYYKYGKMHRDGDLPAIIVYNRNNPDYEETTIESNKRDYMSLTHICPAMCFGISEQKYYKNGVLHRDGDLPAVIEVSEIGYTLIFYKNGEYHRDGNKPAIINNMTITGHFKNGKAGY